MLFLVVKLVIVFFISMFLLFSLVAHVNYYESIPSNKQLSLDTKIY